MKKNGIAVIIAAAAGFAVGKYWPKISASVRETAHQVKCQIEEAKAAATKAVNEEAPKGAEGEAKTEE